MNPESNAYRTAEVVDEISKWTVGLGIITMALFVLSLPILLLTAFALLPLVAPLLAIGLVVAVVAAPILLVRRLVRRRRPPRRHTGEAAERAPGGRPAQVV
jgi:membrane protein implicated in regulation of membrane protease activity